MLSAYNIIGDRTDFKGQSMLPYRVAEDRVIKDHYYDVRYEFGGLDAKPVNVLRLLIEGSINSSSTWQRGHGCP